MVLISDNAYLTQNNFISFHLDKIKDLKKMYLCRGNEFIDKDKPQHCINYVNYIS